MTDSTVTDSAGSASPRTPEEIGAWLRERVAYYLELPAESIDPHSSLALYGLDSLYAFALTAEIEDVLGVRVEPTLLWDVDTLASLTDFVRSLATAV